MGYRLFLDTNALLSLQDKAFNENFVISQKTLEELEDIKSSSKKDGEVKHKARKIARLLDINDGNYTVIRTDSKVKECIKNFWNGRHLLFDRGFVALYSCDDLCSTHKY